MLVLVLSVGCLVSVSVLVLVWVSVLVLVLVLVLILVSALLLVNDVVTGVGIGDGVGVVGVPGSKSCQKPPKTQCIHRNNHWFYSRRPPTPRLLSPQPCYPPLPKARLARGVSSGGGGGSFRTTSGDIRGLSVSGLPDDYGGVGGGWEGGSDYFRRREARLRQAHRQRCAAPDINMNERAITVIKCAYQLKTKLGV